MHPGVPILLLSMIDIVGSIGNSNKFFSGFVFVRSFVVWKMCRLYEHDMKLGTVDAFESMINFGYEETQFVYIVEKYFIMAVH